MKITFLPNQKTQEAPPGASLLDIIAQAGIFIDGSCRGRGNCGRCKVKILSGRVPPLQEKEKELLSPGELAEGYRLACHLRVEDDWEVYIPPLERADHRKAQLTYMPAHFQPEKADKKPGFGIAFDVGTTTVVAILWDLDRTKLVDILALTNPQSVYGADVVTRINFSQEAPGNLRLMQEKIIDCCNQMIHILCHKHKLQDTDIVEATMVGNTTMSHFFLGKDPATLAELPFKPAFTGPVDIAAAALGLQIRPDALVHVLPNIASHVGSDITAGLVAADLRQLAGNHVFVDMGTNGEIVLWARGKAYACSTAAGPAFEAASIYQGMRAATGAVEGIKLEEDGFRLEVIGDVEPMGICGSGLIDAIAAMLNMGVIQKMGRLYDPETALAKGVAGPLAARLRLKDGMTEFVLHENRQQEDLVITQKDVREVQLGKGAIASGIEVLLQKAGITVNELDSIILAGAFGNYIKKESALRIGLLPALAQENILSIGNAAGIGASMALLSAAQRQEMAGMIQEIEHVQLADWPTFQEEFMRAMAFPA